jgi:hypothetical protein
LTGSNVRFKTLTGFNIRSSTLDTVPNASRLGGHFASFFQTRVSGSCSGNSAIKRINSSGSVSCQSTGGGSSTTQTQMMGGSTGTLSGAGNQFLAPSGLSAPNASEDQATASESTLAGTAGHLQVVVATAPGAGKSWTFALRVNAADKLTCTISGTAKGCTSNATGAVPAGAAVDLVARPTASPAATRVTFGWTDAS